MSWIEPAQCNQKLMRADCRIRQAKAYHVGEGSVVLQQPIHAHDCW